MSRAYEVRAVTRGAIETIRMTAPSEDAAHQQVSASGATVLSVRSVRDAGRSGRSGHGFEVAWWCRELGTLLRSGMTVVEAIDTLSLATEVHSEAAWVQQALLRALREGQPLSRALQSAQAFPPVLIASVTASERSGRLVEALDEYLRYDELLARLRRQIVSAAIYPSIVIALGVGITLLLLLFVIPRFSRMYADMAPDHLSTATSVLIWVSGALSTHARALTLTAAGMVGLLAWTWKTGRLRRVGLSMLGVVPALRREWTHFDLARLYHSLALMFRGGYPISEALEVCEGLGLTGPLTTGVRAARDTIAGGRSIGEAFADAGLADLVSRRLLGVGERSGGFEVVLQTIADRHAQRFTTFIERMTRIAEPLLLMLVALLVGGVVIMMYLPIFDLAGQVGSG